MQLVRWTVKKYFAPNSLIFRIRLAEKREEEEEQAIAKRYTFHANVIHGKFLAHKHSHKKNYTENVIFYNLYMSKYVKTCKNLYMSKYVHKINME